MKLRTLMVPLCGALLSCSVAVQAEVSAEKKRLIDSYLELTNAAAVGQLMSDAFVNQLTSVLKQTKPDIDPRAFEVLEEEVSQLINEEMVQHRALNKLSYPIYDRYFTADELAELVRFYSTPVGRKTATVLPTVTKEAMQAGEVWGRSLGPKIQQRIVKRFAAEGIALQ